MMAHQMAVPVVLNGNGGGGGGAVGPAGLAEMLPQTPVSLSIDEVEKRHAALCTELNMDTTAAQASWQSFLAIAQNHTLEVRITCYCAHLVECG